ncbi:MAG: nicotinamide mononucleotide transporter [Hymenobacteraceae bacterium]|nr:nicotinamide mononucleotide transporter [Hymenobacteraceae bacterium]
MTFSPDFLLEAAGVVANLAAVVLAWRRKILTWPAGLVGAVLAGWLLYRTHLYADAALQILFFAQGVYGWFVWRRPARELPIRALTAREWVLLTALVGTATAVIGTLLARKTDAAAPHLDTFLTATSVVANQLLTRKIIDNWPLWLLVDVLYVGLYAYKGLWGYAGLYVVFIGIAAVAWVEWRRVAAAA